MPSLQCPRRVGLPFSLLQPHGREERKELSFPCPSWPALSAASAPWQGAGWLRQSSAAPARECGGKSRFAVAGLLIPIAILQTAKKKAGSRCMGKHDDMDTFL